MHIRSLIASTQREVARRVIRRLILIYPDDFVQRLTEGSPALEFNLGSADLQFIIRATRPEHEREGAATDDSGLCYQMILANFAAEERCEEFLRCADTFVMTLCGEAVPVMVQYEDGTTATPELPKLVEELQRLVANG